MPRHNIINPWARINLLGNLQRGSGLLPAWPMLPVVQTPGTIAELWWKVTTQYAELPCCATRVGRDQWQVATYAHVGQRAQGLAAALLARGLPAKALVGLFADHGEDWLVAHAAIQWAAAADVPRGSDISDGDIQHIAGATQMPWVVVADAALAQRWQSHSQHAATVVVMKGPAPAGVLTMAELEDEGRAALATDEQALTRRRAQLSPEDRHSVIFTSATTGTPKGVVLTHGGMMAQLQAIAQVPIRMGPHDRLLSLLPVWHIFERTVTLASIAGGASLWFTTPRRFAEDLAAVQPTFMASAPRLWEVLDQRIAKALREAHPLRRSLVAVGLWCARHFRASARALRGRQAVLLPRPVFFRLLALGGHALRWLFLLPLHGLFNTAVLERIRQSTGACLKATVSGGGALPSAVDQFFTDLGLQVLEGYGMTEFPVISVRSPHKPLPGTVGTPLPGVELRIVELDSGEVLWPATDGAGQRGEIQVRGPMRLREYYQNPEANAAALLPDGWFRTGDLGCVGIDGALRIVGRSKDTIVLRSGENVEPGPIEDRLAASPVIEQVVVVGQDARHLSALLVPNVELLVERLGLGEASADLTIIADHQPAIELLRREVRSLVNRETGFKPFELIQGVAILPEELRVGHELTNLLKVRRHVVHQRYAEIIARLEQTR